MKTVIGKTVADYYGVTLPKVSYPKSSSSSQLQSGSIEIASKNDPDEGLAEAHDHLVQQKSHDKNPISIERNCTEQVDDNLDDDRSMGAQELGTKTPDQQDILSQSSAQPQSSAQHNSFPDLQDGQPWLPIAETPYSTPTLFSGIRRWKTDKNSMLIVVGLVAVTIIYLLGSQLFHSTTSNDPVGNDTTKVNFSPASFVNTSPLPISSTRRSTTKELASERTPSEATKQQETSTAAPTVVAVSIIGAITHPGLYYMYDYQRINDVLRRAGPLRAGADISGINRADYVEDGEQIVIVQAPHISYVQFSGHHLTTVNINLSSAYTLASVPGISLALAQRIVSYRKTHGKFTSIMDLRNISGIGAARMEKLRPFLRC